MITWYMIVRATANREGKLRVDDGGLREAESLAYTRAGQLARREVPASTGMFPEESEARAEAERAARTQGGSWAVVAVSPSVRSVHLHTISASVAIQCVGGGGELQDRANLCS